MYYMLTIKSPLQKYITSSLSQSAVNSTSKSLYRLHLSMSLCTQRTVPILLSPPPAEAALIASLLLPHLVST